MMNILFALLMIAMAPAVHAQTFRFCSIDVNFPPAARMDGSGHYQFLLELAAREAGLKIERRVKPRRRCLEDLRKGLADGMIGVWSPERAAHAVFPMAGRSPDAGKAFGTLRFFAYRRAGDDLSWDGQRFVALGQGLVGVESAFAFATERLRAAGVPYDDGAKSLEQNFSKLLAARVDAVVAMELEAERLLSSTYAGKIERAGRPFDTTPLYLMVSHQFYARNPDLAARFWQAIQTQRNSEAYRRYRVTHP